MATTGDFTLAGLTLTGGRITANGSAADGGAIHSLTDGNLTLADSIVSGNSIVGSQPAATAAGFGPLAVTLIGSTVSERTAARNVCQRRRDLGLWPSRSSAAPSAETVVSSDASPLAAGSIAAVM